VATLTERIQLLLTANATDAISGLRATGAASRDLDGQMTRTQGSMGKLGAMGGSIAGTLKENWVAMAVVGGAAVGKFAADSVQQFTSLAGTVRDFQRASGASADTASRMVAVFDDLEISQETASRAFFKLSREIGTSDESLSEFGVTVGKTKDGGVDLKETMLRIADAYASTTDQGERAALIQEAFGRGGKELIPILEKGREGIEKLFAAAPDGQIFSQEELDRAREFELAVDDLKDSIQELQIGLGKDLVPALSGYFTMQADVIRGLTDAKDAATGFAGSLSGPLTEGFARSIPVIGPTIGLVKGLGSAFGIGGGESDKFTDSQKRLAEAQKQLTQTFADNTSSAKDKRAAQQELTAAENDYEGVLKRVNKGLQDNTSKLLENMAAGQAYTNAQLGLTGAQLNVEAATNKYNETLAENGAEALETRQAALQLEQSYAALGQTTYDAAIKAGSSTEEAARKQIDALGYVAGTLAPGSSLRVWLDQYINTLQHGIPRQITTRLTIQQALEGYMGDTPPGFSEGGWVGGSGNSDSVLARLTPGEFVLSKDMLAGRSPTPSGVGGGGAPLSATINVYGDTSPEAIMFALTQWVSNNGSVPSRVQAAFGN
jgi:hypothetical protein